MLTNVPFPGGKPAQSFSNKHVHNCSNNCSTTRIHTVANTCFCVTKCLFIPCLLVLHLLLALVTPPTVTMHNRAPVLLLLLCLHVGVLAQGNATNASNPCTTAIQAVQYAAKLTAAARNVTLPASLTASATASALPNPTPELLAAFGNASAAVQQITNSRYKVVVCINNTPHTPRTSHTHPLGQPTNSMCFQQAPPLPGGATVPSNQPLVNCSMSQPPPWVRLHTPPTPCSNDSQ